MKKKLLRIALLAGILGAFFLAERKVTQAADYAVEPYPKAIGRNLDSIGIRIPGIAYSVDGVLKEFSYDIYNKKADGSWEYSHTRINELEQGPDITNYGPFENRSQEVQNPYHDTA